MKINPSSNYKPNFGAIKIADTINYVSNVQTPISVYYITSKDIDFLDYMGKSLKMGDLMPKLSESMLHIWQGIFNIAISQAKGKDNMTLIGFCRNKPCSIINYAKERNAYKINSVCSWPAEQDAKVPYAGKTLFAMLFRDFLQNNYSHIDLDAITNGPFNVVSKYMSLGFKQRGGENFIIAMRAAKEDIIRSFLSLNKVITITPCKTFKEVNLFEKIL